MQLESGRVSALNQVTQTEHFPWKVSFYFLKLSSFICFHHAPEGWTVNPVETGSSLGLEEICGYEWWMGLDRLFGEVIG